MKHREVGADITVSAVPMDEKSRIVWFDEIDDTEKYPAEAATR